MQEIRKADHRRIQRGIGEHFFKMRELFFRRERFYKGRAPVIIQVRAGVKTSEFPRANSLRVPLAGPASPDNSDVDFAASAQPSTFTFSAPRPIFRSGFSAPGKAHQ